MVPVHSPETSFSRYFCLERRAAMGAERLDGAHRQRRGEREGHGAGIPHFERCDIQHMRQGLAAERFRRRQAVPAAGDPVAVERPFEIASPMPATCFKVNAISSTGALYMFPSSAY
jgi:hypothetical protein